MSNVLINLSNELAATVESVGPGLVRVEGRRRMPATGIVWSADGVIVTAHHVVQKENGFKIGLPSGDTVSAELVGRDPSTDLAVLRAEATGLTPAPRAAITADSLNVGHLVLALGRPGRTVQATMGIVSALSDEWRTPAGGKMDYYVQTDVVMYPGFSGGPLVNASGEIVGLNTSALLRGVSLTVPVNTIERVVETLLAHGHIKRGYLGVSTQPVRLPAKFAEDLHQETGLLLISVEVDSPADQAGLLLGDTIVTLAGSPVRQHDDLLSALSGDRVGQAVALQIIRGGQLTEVSVTVGEWQ
jgi:S1-C subfamily serine protease